MMLTLLLVVPLVTGFACLVTKNRTSGQAISYAGLLSNCIIVLLIGKDIFSKSTTSFWLEEVRIPWIPSWSAEWHLGIDVLAFCLIVLTLLLALLAVYISFPKERPSSYFASLNWAIFGALGLFLSADTFLFFLFWELALLPIYWILLIDGGKLKRSQTLRFIVFTQVSGFFLLVAIVALAFSQEQNLVFDYAALTKNVLSKETQYWLLLIFVLAFLIKLPAVPFHGWMPALFSEGPASTILVAILVKTSIYGLVRFSWPMFPEATKTLAMPMMIIGIITLFYGTVLAFSQQEPKRVLAYGTLSHAGLLLLGVFCEPKSGFFGVVVLLIASALSTAAMLMIFERRRDTNLQAVTGLFYTHPKFSVALLVMLLASMGFPLFGNFVGEFLILYAVFAENMSIAIIASIGIILSAAYSLRLFQRLCLHESETHSLMPDLKNIEVGVLSFIALLIIGLGLAPAVVLDQVKLNAKVFEVTLP